jgi:hypothetical protein
MPLRTRISSGLSKPKPSSALVGNFSYLCPSDRELLAKILSDAKVVTENRIKARSARRSFMRLPKSIGFEDEYDQLRGEEEDVNDDDYPPPLERSDIDIFAGAEATLEDVSVSDRASLDNDFAEEDTGELPTYGPSFDGLIDSITDSDRVIKPLGATMKDFETSTSESRKESMVEKRQTICNKLANLSMAVL